MSSIREWFRTMLQAKLSNVIKPKKNPEEIKKYEKYKLIIAGIYCFIGWNIAGVVFSIAASNKEQGVRKLLDEAYPEGNAKNSFRYLVLTEEEYKKERAEQLNNSQNTTGDSKMENTSDDGIINDTVVDTNNAEITIDW